jgi:hypothetical protein
MNRGCIKYLKLDTSEKKLVHGAWSVSNKSTTVGVESPFCLYVSKNDAILLDN